MEKFISNKSSNWINVAYDFDFAPVRDYMLSVNWTWAVPYESEGKVPSINEMRETVLALFRDIVYNHPTVKSYWIETGGFRAIVENGEYWFEFNKKK